MPGNDFMILMFELHHKTIGSELYDLSTKTTYYELCSLNINRNIFTSFHQNNELTATCLDDF